MNSLLPGNTLDLRGERCPLNDVRTKLMIEEVSSGELLEILLHDGEPIKQVPHSIAAAGHDIVGIEKLNDGSYSLFVIKG